MNSTRACEYTGNIVLTCVSQILTIVNLSHGNNKNPIVFQNLPIHKLLKTDKFLRVLVTRTFLPFII